MKIWQGSIASHKALDLKFLWDLSVVLELKCEKFWYEPSPTCAEYVYIMEEWVR